MTRWRAGIYSPGIAGRLKRLFAPGRVLDVGCGSGKKVPEPFIPFGVEISETLSREADDHMRARGGRAIHAPAVDGVREFPDRFFTGIFPRPSSAREAAEGTARTVLARSRAGRLHLCARAELRQPEPEDARRQMVRLPLSRPCELLHLEVARRNGRRLRAEVEIVLANSLRLPLDDNINAVLLSDTGRG